MPVPDLPLPADFHFSQNNLQDFLACPRRFQLKHINHLVWPAVQSEPVIEQEKALARGKQFHQMVHQSFIGISKSILSDQITDPELEQWWLSFCNHPPRDLPSNNLPEYTLSLPFAGYRLIAKFDLLAYQSGSFFIVDWKTNQKKPSRSYLEQRAQTRLYRYVCSKAAAHLNNGQPIAPETIHMLYWFAADPDHPEYFHYSTQEQHADSQWLANLIQQIVTLSNTGLPFPLVDEDKSCAYCVYRSLCGRGVTPGQWDEQADPEAEIEIPFDPDQVMEIAF